MVWPLHTAHILTTILSVMVFSIKTWMVVEYKDGIGRQQQRHLVAEMEGRKNERKDGGWKVGGCERVV
jgi:hypothetical protein